MEFFLKKSTYLPEKSLYYVNDQTRGEIFKQAVEENNCTSNIISACHIIRDERKLHNEDSFIDKKSTIFPSYFTILNLSLNICNFKV